MVIRKMVHVKFKIMQTTVIEDFSVNFKPTLRKINILLRKGRGK